MLISEKPEMLFQTELLIRSVKKFSQNRISHFSIVVNGEQDTSSIVYPSLTRGTIRNKYIAANAEIWRSPYYWEIPIPHRWFIEPKSDTCVFIDADVIACGDLEPLYNLDKNVFHGVPAYKNHLSEKDWADLDVRETSNYFNMGMLVVPSKYLRVIGEAMMNIMDDVLRNYHEHYYFAGQIAVTKALHDLQIEVNHLPSQFNWYDLNFPQNLDNILFLHYISNKNQVLNSNIDRSKNEYLDIIGRTVIDVFNRKLFL